METDRIKIDPEKTKIGFTCTNDGVIAARKALSGYPSMVLHNSIGDWVCLTPFPENFYKTTGQKIIDIDKTWPFDHNPYVDREAEPDKIIDLKAAWFNYGRPTPVMMSLADSFQAFIGSEQLWLRHPKFYRYENDDIIPTRIILHPEGAKNKTIPRVAKDSTIQYALEKYKNFDIYHVGGKNDKKISGKHDNLHDVRGMDLWEVVKLTSRAAIFIGVDSGPYHIARAYPRINRKLIITEDQFPIKGSYGDWDERTWILDPRRDVTFWYDWDTTFFNEFDFDVGITTSYLDI